MMYRGSVLAIPLALALAASAPPAMAQEQQEKEAAAMMEAWQQAGQPGPQHEVLAKLTGEWQAETKFWMDPAGDPMISQGTMEYRMIMNGRYLEEIIKADFMGQPFKGRGLYGYNRVTNEIQAVWIDDMSTGIYTYTGSIAESGDEMVLKGKYMDPVTNKWKETRSVMKIVSPDKLHYMSYETEDGVERKMMEVTATRTASGTGTGASGAR